MFQKLCFTTVIIASTCISATELSFFLLPVAILKHESKDFFPIYS